MVPRRGHRRFFLIDVTGLAAMAVALALTGGPAFAAAEQVVAPPAGGEQPDPPAEDADDIRDVVHSARPGHVRRDAHTRSVDPSDRPLASPTPSHPHLIDIRSAFADPSTRGAGIRLRC
jgi:hypothetical protein